MMGEGISHSMSENNSDRKNQLDLTEAIRILHHAGRPDPRQLTDNHDVQIQSIIDALCDLSVHDGLTGLVNATFFHAVLEREVNRSLRTGRSCGLMVIDIDHFKRINDTYGHSAGDMVIQSVAAHMKHNLRSMDTAARIGGEEFAIILPECAPEDAIHAAERIHSGMNPLLVKMDSSILQLTASAGLVWTNVNVQISSAALLAQADQEMYRAKRSGRARVCHPPVDILMVSRQERSALMNLQFEENKNAR
jgi:diguanylate cyclase (GGDEF)-like protein